YCGYLTTLDVKWRGVDYDARFYTLMVKGKRDEIKETHYCVRPKFNSAGNVRFNNRSDADVTRVRTHFAIWAARQLRGLGVKRISLFPIPNSHVTPGHAGAYGTRDIAELIAKQYGDDAEVIDKLRFRRPMKSSHSGGTRDRLELAAALFLPSGVRPHGTAVLVDDVLTSGAHFLASRDVLTARGIICEDGLVCGRTIDDPIEDPFDIDEEDVDARAFFGARV
ncbi:MAG TPA: hypothetical protein VM915_05105, partial [Verrucomicrobiae bacterium]|nr:hypothetical protein [Verrucomicrobiae bacterium]